MQYQVETLLSERDVIESKFQRRLHQCKRLKMLSQRHERELKLSKQRLEHALEKNVKLSSDIEQVQSKLTVAQKRINLMKGKRKEVLQTITTASNKQKEDTLQYQLQMTEIRKELEEERLKNCRLVTQIDMAQRYVRSS